LWTASIAQHAASAAVHPRRVRPRRARLRRVRLGRAHRHRTRTWNRAHRQRSSQDQPQRPIPPPRPPDPRPVGRRVRRAAPKSRSDRARMREPGGGPTPPRSARRGDAQIPITREPDTHSRSLPCQTEFKHKHPLRACEETARCPRSARPSSLAGALRGRSGPCWCPCPIVRVLGGALDGGDFRQLEVDLRRPTCEARTRSRFRSRPRPRSVRDSKVANRTSSSIRSSVEIAS